VDPFLYTIALAENAAQIGAALFRQRSTAIERSRSATGYKHAGRITQPAGRHQSGPRLRSRFVMLGLTGYRVVGF
jgi:hypothetical protein